MTKVLILGGGPGGYVAAIRAAQLGADVKLIESRRIGGTCLNVGCVPTKSLLHTAEIYTNAINANSYGVNVGNVTVDMKVAQEKKSAIVDQLVGGVEGLLAGNGVEVIYGMAKFKDDDTVTIEKEDGSREHISADKIIVATGSRPAVLPIPGVDLCLSSTEALDLDYVPKSMVIIGGGVIGIEMATIYATLGTDVTIIEMLPNILDDMDGEMSEIIHSNLEGLGIKIHTSSIVKSVLESDPKKVVNVELEDGSKTSISSEQVLLSAGRTLNTDMLEMGKAGIRNDKGRILVDKKMQTNVPGIFAIGDCTGGTMLAHVASAQGEVAAENAMRRITTYDGKTNPSCVYTNPEMASVGYTEEELKDKNIDYKVGKFPLIANAKSLIVSGDGIVKILAGDKYGEVLGVHIVGPRATDLIAEGALAIRLESTLDELISTIHAHPTINEAIREAALVAEKRPIHIM